MYDPSMGLDFGAYYDNGYRNYGPSQNPPPPAPDEDAAPPAPGPDNSYQNPSYQNQGGYYGDPNANPYGPYTPNDKWAAPTGANISPPSPAQPTSSFAPGPL